MSIYSKAFNLIRGDVVKRVGCFTLLIVLLFIPAGVFYMIELGKMNFESIDSTVLVVSYSAFALVWLGIVICNPPSLREALSGVIGLMLALGVYFGYIASLTLFKIDSPIFLVGSAILAIVALLVSHKYRSITKVELFITLAGVALGLSMDWINKNTQLVGDDYSITRIFLAVIVFEIIIAAIGYALSKNKANIKLSEHRCLSAAMIGIFIGLFLERFISEGIVSYELSASVIQGGLIVLVVLPLSFAAYLACVWALNPKAREVTV